MEDELLIITGVDKSSQTKSRTVRCVFLPVKMKNEIVDIKFHVIEGESLDIENDGLLGGLSFHASGMCIYEFTLMPYGLKNAPRTFQHIINNQGV